MHLHILEFSFFYSVLFLIFYLKKNHFPFPMRFSFAFIKKHFETFFREFRFSQSLNIWIAEHVRGIYTRKNQSFHRGPSTWREVKKRDGDRTKERNLFREHLIIPNAWTVHSTCFYSSLFSLFGKNSFIPFNSVAKTT